MDWSPTCWSGYQSEYTALQISVIESEIYNARGLSASKNFSQSYAVANTISLFLFFA